jgi:hypothetical protein
MKRIFVSLSFMLAVGLTTAFADNETDVSSKVKESFKKEFIEAEFVTWSKVEFVTMGEVATYQMVRFVFHNHAEIAYFDEDGELLGSARSILFDELPLAVIKSFERKFSGADFREILEVSNIEGTSYVITEVTKNKQYHVKVNPNGGIMNRFRIK